MPCEPERSKAGSHTDKTAFARILKSCTFSDRHDTYSHSSAGSVFIFRTDKCRCSCAERSGRCYVSGPAFLSIFQFFPKNRGFITRTRHKNNALGNESGTGTQNKNNRQGNKNKNKTIPKKVFLGSGKRTGSGFCPFYTVSFKNPKYLFGDFIRSVFSGDPAKAL